MAGRAVEIFDPLEGRPLGELVVRVVDEVGRNAVLDVEGARRETDLESTTGEDR